MKKSEESLWDLWCKTKRNNSCNVEILEGEEKGTERIFKAMDENSPNLERDGHADPRGPKDCK